uniref:Biopterin-dependent aromatic amino acid hydroxylase family profile domain-containing protein n=1 Tax=Romanomermis culicivorax TaxID=13658 RepID=A0A915IC90_ROMCU
MAGKMVQWHERQRKRETEGKIYGRPSKRNVRRALSNAMIFYTPKITSVRRRPLKVLIAGQFLRMSILTSINYVNGSEIIRPNLLINFTNSSIMASDKQKLVDNRHPSFETFHGYRRSLIDDARFDALVKAEVSRGHSDDLQERLSKKLAAEKSENMIKIFRSLNENGVEFLCGDDGRGVAANHAEMMTSDEPISKCVGKTEKYPKEQDLAVVFTCDADMCEFVLAVMQAVEKRGIKINHLETRKPKISGRKPTLIGRFDILIGCSMSRDQFIGMIADLADQTSKILSLKVFTGSEESEGFQMNDHTRLPFKILAFSAIWVPKYIGDLDACGHTKSHIEPDLDSRHPSSHFADHKISNSGDKIPMVEYTAEETETWQAIECYSYQLNGI